MIKNALSCICMAAVLLISAGPAAAQPSEGSRQLTLRQAVEEALANNLNLRLRLEDTNIAQGAVEIAESRFDKTLTAKAAAESEELTPLSPGAAQQEDTGRFGVGFSKQFTTGTEMELGWANSRYDSDAAGLTLNPSYGSTVSLDLSQPLMKGMGRDIQTASVEAAEKGFEAATYQVDSLAADLAAQVKTGYWDFVFARQDIEVRRFSLDLAQKLLEETEAKISAGNLAPVELYQPQSEVARREEELIGAERSIGAAEDQLKLLMNTNEWLVDYIPVDEPTTAPIQLDQIAIYNNAVLSRPDLKAAELDIAAARLQEKIAEDDLRPVLNLVGGLGYGGTDEGYGDAVGAAIDEADTRWQIGLNFSYPLDNSFAEGSYRQAKATHSKAKTSAELLRQEIKRSVRTTVRDVHLAIKAMEATRKTSLATLKRLEAEQAKFEAGRSTTLDVLIAQEAYSQALSQENRTSIVYAQALAELDRIQGLVTFANPE